MKPLLVTLLYGAAGVAVGLGGYLVQRLLSPKAPPPSPDAQTPYECGEAPIDSPWKEWAWPFLPLATILLLLEAEVLFLLPWVWAYRSLSFQTALLELFLVAIPIAAAYAYLLQAGYLISKPNMKKHSSNIPQKYQDLQSYLLHPTHPTSLMSSE